MTNKLIQKAVCAGLIVPSFIQYGLEDVAVFGELQRLDHLLLNLGHGLIHARWGYFSRLFEADYSVFVHEGV